jgi:DNA-binding NtrC family response regulator
MRTRRRVSGVASRHRKFVVLLSGKKELMERVRRFIHPTSDMHLQFASSPHFLSSRAIFKTPDVVLLDVTHDTIALRSALGEFSAQFPDVPVLAMAHESDHGSAVELVKLGVSAYFIVPDDQRKITQQITMLHNDWIAKGKKEKFVQLQREVFDFRQIIGKSALLTATIERARKVIANSTVTVLITGETGTGKELFARAVHYNGKNRNSPFVDIACSALPESLLESELFGYEKGAFTDAKERKIGLFELAGDGSIFLDEIGDISLAIQSKLLKVIEDHSMRRVGGVRDVPVRARVIAATSADLEAKMRSGEFRKDLYHRLKILPLELPPLRERKEDIPLLCKGFLDSFNKEYQKKIRGLTPQALQILMEHDWEGNVRELKHSIERAFLLEESDWITEEDFEFGSKQARTVKRKVLMNTPESLPPKEVDSVMLLVPLDRASLSSVQRSLAEKVLDHVGGNKLKTAKILGISRPRLDRILRNQGDGREG